MSSSNVVEMIRPFDPMEPDAEERYDAVVRRLNRTRARRMPLERERDELERQFVANDLRIRSGPLHGEPLSVHERRRRLARLCDLDHELRLLRSEERFSAEALEHMNAALDRWARDTYSPGGSPGGNG
jgi:hypothetical protein